MGMSQKRRDRGGSVKSDHIGWSQKKRDRGSKIGKIGVKSNGIRKSQKRRDRGGWSQKQWHKKESKEKGSEIEDESVKYFV